MQRLLLFWLFLFALCLHSSLINGQEKTFSDIELRIDTSVYRLSEVHPRFQETGVIPFRYRHEHEMAVLTPIYPPGKPVQIIDVRLSPGIILQNIESISAQHPARIYMRFDQITMGNFFRVTIGAITAHNDTVYYSVELQPVADMLISLMPPSEDIYLGEEMVYELNTNIPLNIVPGHAWTNLDDYHYRLFREGSKVYLNIAALSPSRQTFEIEVDLYKPILDPDGNLRYKTVFTTPEFHVKESRLAFLGTDLREVILDEDSRSGGIELQIDNHRLLKINRTYRIEAQEEPGGTLIAELFTKNSLASNKVLCILRPYNLHESRSGYLYLKDGDEARFMINFSVVPKTAIRSVQILREGREWSDRLIVNPNETAILRIMGQSLTKSMISFDIPGGRTDTISWTDNEAEVRVFIPMYIPKGNLNLLVSNKATGHSITVAEYQRPRPLDFISIDYGESPRSINAFAGPLFYESTIRDIRILFDHEMIDQGERLYGIQYLDIEVRIFGSRGEVLESFKLNNVAICPADNSPRYSYYPARDCRATDVSLNQYLSRKTFHWDVWTQAVINISHCADKYPGGQYSKTVEIILQQPFKFDVDVSFPAGLLIIRPGQDEIGNLSGISMAIVAQFSFYHRNKIAKLKPYSIGAGFLALNAFNFSENDILREMGVVVIGSVFPTRRDAKMSFPLYAGGGFFLNQSQWFLLLGPGIRVSF